MEEVFAYVAEGADFLGLVGVNRFFKLVAAAAGPSVLPHVNEIPCDIQDVAWPVLAQNHFGVDPAQGLDLAAFRGKLLPSPSNLNGAEIQADILAEVRRRVESAAVLTARLTELRTADVEGTIARNIREDAWPKLQSADACDDKLLAAKLRLILCFLHHARLMKNCSLLLDDEHIVETIAAKLTVTELNWLAFLLPMHENVPRPHSLCCHRLLMFTATISGTSAPESQSNCKWSMKTNCLKMVWRLAAAWNLVWRLTPASKVSILVS